MTDIPRIQLNLDFSTNWCSRHLEPFHEKWPHGAPTAMMLILDAFVNDERTLKMGGYNPDTGQEAKPEHLNALIIECSPLCCFIGDELMREITEQALSGNGPLIDELKKNNAEVLELEDDNGQSDP
jgi:hypothetical protein